jgi:hypothetical protein
MQRRDLRLTVYMRATIEASLPFRKCFTRYPRYKYCYLTLDRALKYDHTCCRESHGPSHWTSLYAHLAEPAEPPREVQIASAIAWRTINVLQ